MGKLDELINKLCPNGVKFVKLEELCPVMRGKRLTKSQLSDNGRYVVYHGSKDTPLGFYDNYNVDGDTVIVVNTGGIGGVKYNKENFWCSDGSFWIKHNDNINNKFLYYYLVQFEDYYLSQKRIGGVPTIDKSVVSNTCIPVPPMEVQNEIVHVLDNFTLLSAELSAELKARQKQYEYYRNEMINKSKGKMGKLIELLSQPITDGPHTTPKLYSTGVPFVSATAVYNGKVHLEDAKGYISKEFDNECSKKYKPQRNDVYMVKSGSTTGKVAYVDFDADFNIWSPLAAMRTNNEITSRYLYHLLQTTDVQNQVLAKMSHGSQPNLSMRVLEQFDVKIPDLEEQKRIINILDKLDCICNDIFKGLPAEIEARKKQYEYYRDKLLTFKELKVEN